MLGDFLPASSARRSSVCVSRLRKRVRSCGLVGLGEGRVERGQHLALLDDLAGLHVDALDDRGLQRLHHDVLLRIDQAAVAR